MKKEFFSTQLDKKVAPKCSKPTKLSNFSKQPTKSALAAVYVRIGFRRLLHLNCGEIERTEERTNEEM